MIHGWPDTLRLWDAHRRRRCRPRWRCVRFTLPGFDLSTAATVPIRWTRWSRPSTASSPACCPGQRVTLLVHDWGCLYRLPVRAAPPELVSRIVGVDIGDAGSTAHQAELGAEGQADGAGLPAVAGRLPGASAVRSATAWPAAWRAAMRCPAEPQAIGAQMGYPYAVQWFGVRGGFGGVRPFEPAVPMLYLYGRAQALHVPFAGLGRGAGAAARQPRRRPAHGALGDAEPAAGVQRRGGALAGRDGAASSGR